MFALLNKRAGNVSDKNIIVSSAKDRIFSSVVLVDMSLIDIRKSNGPSMEPCGTPNRTGKHDDAWELILIYCVLFVR